MNDDLTGCRCPRGVSAVAVEHGTLNLSTGDPLLDDDLGIEPTRLLDGGCEIITGGDLGDADRRAAASGFDEDRHRELADAVQASLTIVLPLMGTHDDVGAHQDARLTQHHLGEVLVHAVRRGRHTTTDVASPVHLEQPLDGAVLTVGAVQEWEDHVDGGVEPVTGDEMAAVGMSLQGDARMAGTAHLGKRASPRKVEDVLRTPRGPHPIG